LRSVRRLPYITTSSRERRCLILELGRDVVADGSRVAVDACLGKTEEVSGPPCDLLQGEPRRRRPCSNSLIGSEAELFDINLDCLEMLGQFPWGPAI
jgi:hypothetical protein